MVKAGMLGGIAAIITAVGTILAILFTNVIPPDPDDQSEAPTAVISMSSGPYEVDESLTLSAAGSYDPDGSIVSYQWDFDDGTSGSGSNVSHIYSTSGSKTVRLTVTDNDGASVTISHTINIQKPTPMNKEPTAIIDAPLSGEQGKDISFSAKDSFDPDGSIVSYRWAFGDGSVGSGDNVQHKYSTSGSKTVRLTVTDNDGASVTISHTINIQPSDPIPNPILILTSIEEYEVSGKQFGRYRLSIDNWNSYPPELFEQAPDLPPCGLNENASRTWVDIYNAQTNARIYGFCALDSPNDLTNIWFSIDLESDIPPTSVYVVLKDRQENKNYKSNLLSLT